MLITGTLAGAQLAFDNDTPTATALLTLSGVAPYTTWFTNKPERRAGSLDSGFFATGAGFYTGADWLGAPNAVLTGQAAGRSVTVVLTLFSPIYFGANASLTYKVTVISNAPEAAAAAAAVGRPRTVEVQDVSLFVDDYIDQYNGCKSTFVSCPWYGGGWYYPGGWWGGPTYSGNIPIGRGCPDCGNGENRVPPGTLPPATPFPPSVNDEVPMPPVDALANASAQISFTDCSGGR
ncbi:hypothetical protein WJX81_008054 [Elliptochloris bilobata]|uniref:Uncharacterized protein n=1 Tax=Elliptochloris bilobata TaxID=381761 RepID=A0AAW1RT54_9CHLO